MVAMEATGVYWKPVWHVLSDGDFELVLANAKQVENVPGRKTDVNDAAWLADLLTHGLIRGSFVPDAETQVLRTYCARANNSFAREAATFSDFRRHWRMRTSSSIQWLPTSLA